LLGQARAALTQAHIVGKHGARQLPRAVSFARATLGRCAGVAHRCAPAARLIVLKPAVSL
jgi:hypothetical protein